MICECGYSTIELSHQEMLDEITIVTYCENCGRAQITVEDEIIGEVRTRLSYTPHKLRET